jgi:Cytochrome bd-type quinol oxidase, subunit 1
MKNYHLTVLVMGLGLAVAILHLVRRDHLYIRQGVFWIGVALVSLLFGVWPYLIDSLGEIFGSPIRRRCCCSGRSSCWW